MDTVDTMRFNTKHELWITMDYLYLTLKHAMRKTQLLPEASLAPQKFAMSLLVSTRKPHRVIPVFQMGDGTCNFMALRL